MAAKILSKKRTFHERGNPSTGGGCDNTVSEDTHQMDEVGMESMRRGADRLIASSTVKVVIRSDEMDVIKQLNIITC